MSLKPEQKIKELEKKEEKIENSRARLEVLDQRLKRTWQKGRYK